MTVTHRKSKTSVYRTWCRIIERCTNAKKDMWQYYGGRGIKVCDRWRKFENFIADMGEAPTIHHSVDRINNDGDYEPKNCRWATRKEQMNNRNNSVFVEFNGKTQTLTQWAHEYGLCHKVVWSRFKTSKWPIEKCLTTPVKR